MAAHARRAAALGGSSMTTSIDPRAFAALLAKTMQIDIAQVTDDASLVKDLGADSLDAAEISIALEEAYGISEASAEHVVVEMGDQIRTVAALRAYVETHAGEVPR